MRLALDRSVAAGALAAAVAVSLLLAAPAFAAPSVYDGTVRQIVRTGQVPQVPPAQSIPNWGGTLSVTPAGNITLPASQADFTTNFTVTMPPTFAGVLQQTSFLTFNNFGITAMLGPGSGPGPFATTFTTMMGGGAPPLNPTFGVPSRFGAASAVGVQPPAQNYGGSIPFIFNFVAQLVFFGGGGGQPNLACPNAVPGAWGQSFTTTALAECIGLTTGPLPAQTLPSVMVPQHVSIQGFPLTANTVFVGAPAPVTTTTLTDMGSFSLNTGVAVPGGTGTTGMIQLVAPGLFQAQLGGPLNLAGQNQAALITEYTLTLLPEPGLSLMLVAGVAGLFAVRRLERRHRS